MINNKYYQDIKKFVLQLKESADLSKEVIVEGKYERVIVCGMGGSSLYADIINDILESVDEKKRIDVVRGYDLPSWVDNKTLVIASSYSGNTEESISCYLQARERNLPKLVITSGGQLLELAHKNKETLYQIPAGIQPRLSTGYFIGGLVNILAKNGFLQNSEKLLAQFNSLELNIDEEYAKNFAKKLINYVPIIYATNNIGSIARVSKIKFNENSKIQAFYNVIPELNHNEMVGFTNLLMEAYFIVFKSKFAHIRNHKRIEVFSGIMQEKNINVELITPLGDTIVEEIFNIYHFIDYVTYYLAEEYNIDPEPVKMVEDFKSMIG